MRLCGKHLGEQLWPNALNALRDQKLWQFVGTQTTAWKSDYPSLATWLTGLRFLLSDSDLYQIQFDFNLELQIPTGSHPLIKEKSQQVGADESKGVKVK